MIKRSIEFPELNDRDITTIYAQPRPERQEGLRI